MSLILLQKFFRTTGNALKKRIFELGRWTFRRWFSLQMKPSLLLLCNGWQISVCYFKIFTQQLSYRYFSPLFELYLFSLLNYDYFIVWMSFRKFVVSTIFQLKLSKFIDFQINYRVVNLLIFRINLDNNFYTRILREF